MEQYIFHEMHYFCLRNEKKRLAMVQLSKLVPIFVASVEKDWQHRGELFSFDPLENLQNSLCTGEKSESCSSCSSIYTAYSYFWSQLT